MQSPHLIDKDLKSAGSFPEDSLLATDLDGNILFCNETFIKLYQLRGTKVRGLPIDSIFNNKEAGIFKSALLKCVKNKLYTEKLSFKKPGDNSEFDIYECFMKSICNNKGVVSGVVLNDHFINQSALHSTNKEIDFKKECFSELANHMPDLMWVTDKHHQLIYVNTAWLHFRGTSLEVEMGNGWLDHVHPEDKEQVVQERRQAFVVQQPYAITFRFKKNDGCYRWMNMKGNPVYSDSGNFKGYAGTALDITPVKEAQIQIRRQQELMESTKIEFGKFTKIAQKIGSIIIMCNSENRITWVNDAFVKTTGYTLKEVCGKTPGSFLKGAETSKETLDRIRKVIELGKGIRTEILYYTKTGARIWLDLMIETLFDKEGTVTGYITIQKDITLKKISEKEVLEQMSHLKKISFITSHELRHEFSKILQLLQTAKFQDHNLATYAQIFTDIEYSANLMNDAIFKLNDQINFASSNSISLNKYLLNQAIEEICLVDDDHLVNKLNELIIRNVMPSMPVHTFDHIDKALGYVKENPNTKRKIFLDLNFSGRSGWDFLHEYEKLGQPWPVVILTSSIDHVDYERSKKFLNVTHFITKPLTIEQFEKLSDMENVLVH
jgi:PAS domain S-box-containing protein